LRISNVTRQVNEKNQKVIRSGLYVYPSKLSCQFLKNEVKQLTLRSNLYLSAYELICKLNPIIRKWVHRFCIGTATVFAKLDHYIFIRCWVFIKKKYKTIKRRILFERYFSSLDDTGRTWHFKGQKVNTSLRKQGGIDIRRLLLIIKIIVFVPVNNFRVSSKLLSCKSYYLDAQPFIYWNLKLVRIRSKGLDSYYEKLYLNQNGICPLCNHSLSYLYLDTVKLEVDHIIPLRTKNISLQKLLSVSNLQLVHKSCHAIKTSFENTKH